MSFEIEPGYALGCTVNSHRQGWDGTICNGASAWSCGAKQDFRDDYCARGDRRCFHINLFAETNPHLLIPDDGIGWILDDDPHLLDDQILVLWGRQFSEPGGIAEAWGTPKFVFGAYRIQKAERFENGRRIDWRLVPHPDGWCRLTSLKLDIPRFQHLPGPYIKSVERVSVERIFKQGQDVVHGGATWHTPADEQRFANFARNISAWFDAAAKRVKKAANPARTAKPRVGRFGAGATPFKKFAELQKSESPTGAPAGEIVVSEAAPNEPLVGTLAPTVAPVLEPLRTAPPQAALIEPAKRDWIVARHGKATLTKISVGTLTKPLLILRGNPGVGKSTLALNLIDDPQRERTLVVPVSSTWRGREDLLGYVNPIHNTFEPTRFTNFLHQAAKAHDRGDPRVHLVIFEEFNLSQPEYWLSDVLVRSQFPTSARRDRTLELGGQSVRGWPVTDPPELFLSPSVRFVATINNDHTTRPLSPRVLDRAAVVEVTIDPRHAVQQAGLALDEEQIEAIGQLDFITSLKGATFSLRSALSLKACADDLGGLGIDLWGAIDLVLVQEVLSKVRLLVGDPADLNLVERLKDWSERESRGKNLPECARLIASWEEALQEGLDVSQA
ncbi:MAG: AAA family ATPase [Planctomycetes bacterium]|nr:AAA family ATPase [Planctomycetota bacterium]